jgi:hypothetical protein
MAALRAATFPLRHPAVWSWPWAAWLAYSAATTPLGMLGLRERLAYNYLPALGLILLGCLPSMVVREPRPPERPAPFLSRRVLIGLTVAVLFAATFLRVWKLWEWPPDGIGLEEWQLGGRAPLGNWAPAFLDLYSQPGEHTLTVYSVSVVFGTLGPGFLQLRLPFIIASILCPFLLYAVCRRLVSWEVSLFAVALFAVSWWQIAAGRIADEIFYPIWVELAILWLLIHFEDTGRTWAAYFVALLTGLLIYEYTSYHLAIIVVAGYLLARLVLFLARWTVAPDRALGRWRELGVRLSSYAPGATAMVMVVLIIAHLQLVQDLRQKGFFFSGGVGGHEQDPDGLQQQLSTPEKLPAFLERKLLIPIKAAYWPRQGEYCQFTGIGGVAAFDKGTAIAMGLGFVLVGLTFWRRFHALALIWALLVIAGAALLPQNANLHRYYTGLPFYYLLIALGAEVLWRALRQPLARYALLGVFAVTITYAAVDNTRYLFWNLMPNPQARANWTWPRTEVIRWIRQRERNDWICVIADDELSINGANPLQVEWKYLIHGWNVRISPSGAECIPAPDAGDGAKYYVFTRPDTPADPAALLHAHYPDARELEPIEVPHMRFTARTFYVPP